MAKTAAQQKTATFLYEGLDRKGSKVKGEISGKGPALVRAELRRQGIQARKVIKKRELSLGGKKKIKPADIALFTRQMATMMKAGVPLVQSFDIVADGLDNPSMKDVVLKIKTEVEGGNNFAGALRQHPTLFDDLYCSLIESGEASGSLETMLDRVALYKEKSEALKSKIRKAVKYPIAVICVAVIVTGILLVKVVPTFQELFEGFGAELPAFTQFVIGLSEGLQAHFLPILLGAGAIIAGFIQGRKRSQTFKDAVDRLLLRLPIIGDITHKATVARFARTLSTTFAAGVPLIDALDACAGATGNVVYRKAVVQVKEDVATGQQLQFAMRSTGVFPPMALQMTAIGEESGALDGMLGKVATYYEDEVDNLVDGLTSMLEPLIMSVLGVLIGGLIIAMYLPIFQLGQVV
ncbi:type II secretion system F family protein [Alloalcanivorax xenomutans]|jgi:type IV pilus assembly protein PilC|uniref:Type II secretion system F family protein n=1 Tax=Alloalcanivorax xenomutans TaxID=1094342 RepID=A0A9Q3W6L4_9GAMM|nr:type II secretion system F family protein [Alloalcanivorax xenomutans]ERS13800.1 type II secretion system protein F [Alcanivorax sp. PN-3]KYZ84335.1 type II secretion system protein F [Alcanivorax sp. KX64203]ARB46793.1 type II secretion system protein F [Alloalcanivorax xenomutans]MCE7509785.1 type II secretion system F family protein [Alloalcanivorax xenomutans]WOD27417.1 type II secretion system F family protein [Alloalcanivorax xenomutans]